MSRRSDPLRGANLFDVTPEELLLELLLFRLGEMSKGITADPIFVQTHVHHSMSQLRVAELGIHVVPLTKSAGSFG